MEVQINYTPQPHQAVFHDDKSRIRVIKGGRRSGKSECSIHELIRHAISNPGMISWYVAPTYRDAYEIGWDKVSSHFNELEPVIQKINRSELSIQWVNGHVTYFKGAENEKSLRGRGLSFVILDECAFMKDIVYFQLIRPALMDTQGSCVLITTPNGRNWFYEFFQNVESSYSWTTSDNELIPDSEIELAKSSMSDNDFRQEILAEFVTRAGMVYDDFNEQNIKQLEWDITECDVGVGIDFGFVNPTAIVIMLYNKVLDDVYLINEIYVSRQPIERICNSLSSMLESYGIKQEHVKIYTDPAGNAAELSSGISPVDFLRSKGYNVYNKGTDIAPGLALVRRFIRTADGKRHFYINPMCKEAIRSMYGYTYETNTRNEHLIKEEPLKDGLHDHMTDAIRYYFVNRFDHAKYVAYSPDVQSYRGIGQATPTMKRCTICKRTFFSRTPKNKPPYVCSTCKEDL